MAKHVPWTLEEVRSKLSYDPATGRFTWLVKPARNICVGDEAGTFKGSRTNRDGVSTRYMYIRIDNYEVPAARVAWLLHYGEWPAGNVLFNDRDPSNLKIANLRPALFPAEPNTNPGALKPNKMSREAQRHYGLKRYYGITGEHYGAMLAEQKGLCAVCQKPETAVFNGAPKSMHVDHDHVTGRIRALLCGSCNGMLGLAKDDPAVLRAAADYIEHHRQLADNVVPLKTPEEAG